MANEWQIEAVYAELLAQSSPDARVEGAYAEVLTQDSSLAMRVSVAYAEALTRSYTAEVLADLPAAYFRLDEASGTTLTDASGNARNATVDKGSFTFGGAPAQPGIGGSSAAVSSSRASTATASWWSGTTITVEAWIKTSSTATQFAVVVLDSQFTTSNAVQRCWLGVDSTGHAYGGFPVGGVATQVTSTTMVRDGAWHHVVLVRNGTSVKVYIDGAEDGSATMSATAQAASTLPLRIGAGDTGNTGAIAVPMIGSLDEVAVYMTALTPERIAAHYTASGAVTGPAPITGTIAATGPVPTGTSAGTVAGPTGGITGTVAASGPAPTAASTGTVTGPAGITGTLASTGPPATASAAGTVALPVVTGTLAAAGPAPAASSAGTVVAPPITGTIAGTGPAPTGAAAGLTAAPGEVAGTLVAVGPQPTAAADGDVADAPAVVTGVLAAIAPTPTAAIAGATDPEPPLPTDPEPVDPPNDVQVSAATSVVETPAWLDLSVSNATPLSSVEFYIDGDLAYDVVTDDAGQAVGMSVPLGLLAAGTHDVRVYDVASDRSTTVEFEVLFDPAPIPAGPTPPTSPTPVPVVNRWTFEDPAPGGEVLSFPTNPARMTTPHAARVFALDHTTSPVGQPLTFEGEPLAVEWTIEGTCLTQEFYEAMERFQALNRRFFAVDHLDRGWVVTFEALDWTQMRDRRYPWGHTYRAKFLIYAGPLTPE